MDMKIHLLPAKLRGTSVKNPLILIINFTLLPTSEILVLIPNAANKLIKIKYSTFCNLRWERFSD